MSLLAKTIARINLWVARSTRRDSARSGSKYTTGNTREQWPMLNYTIDDLNAIRDTELDLLLQKHGAIFSGATVLEVGTGTGRQLTMLSRTADAAFGIDVPDSSYHPGRSGKVACYDGVHLPFPDDSFDVIYSSNTMEHVLNERDLHNEFKRVLRPTGVAIHVVPSSTWRLWTVVTYYLMLPKLITAFLHRRSERREGTGKASTAPIRNKGAAELLLDLICPARHGERGNRFTEWWHFRGASWRRRFEELGWSVKSAEGLGLFYTGYLVGARWLSMGRRQRIVPLLGSSCLVFILEPAVSS
jgi:SAM-dependent methyltransferase